jgi:drug/metabolite transporter (DMT)-like permease
MAIILPTLSFIMFFIGFLAFSLACYDRRHEKITYIKVIAASLFLGFVFHVAAIFFGEKIH